MVSALKTVWIDCDPGADDALGILLLAASGIKIGGIVSCFGNGSSETTALNATKVLSLTNRGDIPVFQGADQPLVQSFTPTPLYSGEDGLCNTGLVPEETLLRKDSFIDCLREEFQRTGQPVTWIATGALTNLARLIKTAPDLLPAIDEVITASGCFGLTKYASRAEWNIEIDPHAAETVFSSGLPIRAVGLDVTGQLRDSYAEEVLAGIPEGAVQDFLNACTIFNRSRGLNVSSLLNDAMAAAVFLYPEFAEYERGITHVFPGKKGTEMMAFQSDPHGNVSAAFSYDFGAYTALLTETLK